MLPLADVFYNFVQYATFAIFLLHFTILYLFSEIDNKIIQTLHSN